MSFQTGTKQGVGMGVEKGDRPLSNRGQAIYLHDQFFSLGKVARGAQATITRTGDGR